MSGNFFVGPVDADPNDLSSFVDIGSTEEPTFTYADPEDGRDLLSRIDAATAGLCPCGAEPQPGSVYCSEDCRPTHIGKDTDRNGPGGVSARHGVATAMRWRPDLVSAAPDEGLRPMVGNTFYAGRFNAQVFLRTDRPYTWHLRLDDNYRFVGCDLNQVGEVDEQLVQRLGEAWAKLERELGNARHMVADFDPWAGVFIAEPNHDPAPVNDGSSYARGGSVRPSDRLGAHTTFSVQDEVHIGFDPAGGGSMVVAQMRGGHLHVETIDFTPLAERAQRFVTELGSAAQAAVQSLRRLLPAEWFEPEVPQPHPMLAAIEARRNRNTGPPQQQRAPRRIDARGTR